MYRKALLIFFVSLVSIFSVKAQRYNLVLGPEVAFPAGQSANQSPIGFGASLKAEVGISEKFSFTGSGAVMSFLGKRFFRQRQPTNSYVPIKAGLKYYTDENFYIEGQIGASLPMNHSGRTAFAWSPGIGSFVKNKRNSSQLDVGLRYEGWVSSSLLTTTGRRYANFGFFSLRAAYAFNL
ncbi:MAG: hypothetical protein EOO90_05005 [Pedobacter sp.]|nr:MAG: hypothetical protein EOO90_05005 [Pedobacter sp.]